MRDRAARGVVVQFGGQTPLKLAAGLEEAGVPILGTSIDAIDLAEDRSRFGALLDRLGYKAPPLRQRRLVRGGARAGSRRRLPAARAARATCSAAGRWRSSTTSTACATTSSGSASATRPATGAEHDLPRPLPGGLDRGRRRRAVRRHRRVDRRDHAARRGGRDPLRRLGLRAPAAHARRRRCSPRSASRPRESRWRSGSSACSTSSSRSTATEGLHVIEANPRASRTVPFVSKAIGLPLAKLACRILLGERIADLDLPEDTDQRPRVRQGGRAPVRPLRRRRHAARARRCARPAR